MDEKKERGPFVEEDFDGPERPSDLQRKFNLLTRLADLEEAGHHAHALEEAIDPTKDKAIAHEIEELGQTPYEEGSEDCWNSSRRYDIKRRDARTVNTLLYRNWPG